MQLEPVFRIHEQEAGPRPEQEVLPAVPVDVGDGQRLAAGLAGQPVWSESPRARRVLEPADPADCRLAGRVAEGPLRPALRYFEEERVLPRLEPDRHLILLGGAIPLRVLGQYAPAVHEDDQPVVAPQ